MSNDNRLVIYSIKYLHSVPLLTIELSSRIKEIEKDKHIIVDWPGTGEKLCSYFAYIHKSYIFDNGFIFGFIANPKRVDKKYALQYLLNYERNGRLNCKDYTIKKPTRIDYDEFLAKLAIGA